MSEPAVDLSVWTHCPVDTKVPANKALQLLMESGLKIACRDHLATLTGKYKDVGMDPSVLWTSEVTKGHVVVQGRMRLYRADNDDDYFLNPRIHGVIMSLH